MKIQLLSDAHLEMRLRWSVGVAKDADVLVLAGDIHTSPDGIEVLLHRVRKQSSIPIITVLGNHENYGNVFLEVVEEYREVCSQFDNVFLLEKGAHTIDDTVFLGTTLYTDLSNQMAALAARQGLSDFHVVKRLTPNRWTKEHQLCKKFLQKELAKRRDKTVVVTHMVPTFLLTPKKYKGNRLEPCFSVELGDMITEYQPDLWIYGHNHFTDELMMGKTRLISNQQGYPQERTGYKKGLLVEV